MAALFQQNGDSEPGRETSLQSDPDPKAYQSGQRAMCDGWSDPYHHLGHLILVPTINDFDIGQIDNS